MPHDSQLDPAAIHALRSLSIDSIDRANSGHPGLPLGAAPMAWMLWQHHLRHAPQRPDWPNRDRFVLSAGHGSALLYSLLHLTGYDLSLDDLKSFRQLDSRTPGHPEFGHTAGVEATTGPLGQGSANSVGMAMAERWLAEYFNRPKHTLVDHFSYALVSDGDLMEGLNYEAVSLAGHLSLGKLIWLYDSNEITLDGPASLSFDPAEMRGRFEAAKWQVLEVEDGDQDLDSIDAAIVRAKAEAERPTLIIVNTTIGFGSPTKAGKAASHGAPLGAEETQLTKKALGYGNLGPFEVPEVAKTIDGATRERGAARLGEWDALLESYRCTFPDLAREWDQAWAGEFPTAPAKLRPTFDENTPVATRVAGGKTLQAFAKEIPWLIGGDADLSSSTKTRLADEDSFGPGRRVGRNIHFGVREHAMGAIANGMLYHGGVRPFVSTFFVFSDYMRPAVRLAALSGLPAIYVWTHDSIGVGEDGPTHQPVEHLSSLRAMPNLRVWRPGDAHEAAMAWEMALEHRSGPSALVLSRQNLSVQKLNEDARRGGYILAEAEGDAQVLLIATGSEVGLAMEARALLQSKGIPTRVVSMPCVEIFLEQPKTWREEVLPPTLRRRISLEAGVTHGWHRFVGDEGLCLGVDRFGASAPAPEIFQRVGLDVDSVVTAAEGLLAARREGA